LPGEIRVKWQGRSREKLALLLWQIKSNQLCLVKVIPNSLATDKPFALAIRIDLACKENIFSPGINEKIEYYIVGNNDLICSFSWNS